MHWPTYKCPEIEQTQIEHLMALFRESTVCHVLNRLGRRVQTKRILAIPSENPEYIAVYWGNGKVEPVTEYCTGRVFADTRHPA